VSGRDGTTADGQIEALRRLARKALTYYEGRFGEPEIVKCRENAVFSVAEESGGRFALRVHRPGYHSHRALRSELTWMQALTSAGIAVPEVRLNRLGRPITPVPTTEGAEPRHVDLLHWIDAPSLSALENTTALDRNRRLQLYRQVGVVTARLHDHGADWPLPPGFERHDWFSNALVGSEPLWGSFWELPCLTRAEQALLGEVRRLGAAALAHYPRTQSNSGLIHADLIADNLMVAGDEIRPIDFDDAGFGWHMFDIATTLYFLSDDVDFDDLRDALIAGYRSVRGLPDSEVAMLPLFLMLRGTTYLGWVGSRSETATAREQTPLLVARCCAISARYLEKAYEQCERLASAR
jgi:Ser/Thr protein kinase RdoA (MazF antagonist)